jgi:hypothetical protein
MSMNRKGIERQPTRPSQPLSRDKRRLKGRETPPRRGPGSHSNNPYLLEHSYGLGVLAQRDPVSIRLRVSKKGGSDTAPTKERGSAGWAKESDKT